MKQFLVILRGAPASGKTTIAKQLRNFENKIVWLKVDNFKDFFSDESHSEEQKFVDESALATLEYLLENGFSVVMEKIFYDPMIISRAIQTAQLRGISAKVFHVYASLETLLHRDKHRPGVKEGCRTPLGNERISNIFTHLNETNIPGSIKIDTEKLSLNECVELINNVVSS